MKNLNASFPTRDEFKEILDRYLSLPEDRKDIICSIGCGRFTVSIHYAMPVRYNGRIAHMLTMVDSKCPYFKSSHGYPKLYDPSDYDALYTECEREFKYILDIHNSSK